MREIKYSMFFPLAATIISAFGFSGPALGDSTIERSEFSIPRSPDESIIGGKDDGMSCRYKGNDGLIHCIFGNSKAPEWLAYSVSKPKFNDFGTNRFGQYEFGSAKAYSFLNAETSSAEGGGGTAHCKLTLQFLTTANEIIWIWHDELRFDGSSQYAALDTNGDGIADKAVGGQWNGKMGGSGRWTPASSGDNRYSVDEQVFAARPVFGKAKGAGRPRTCDAEGVGIAEVRQADGQIGISVDGLVPVWRSELRP